MYYNSCMHEQLMFLLITIFITHKIRLQGIIQKYAYVANHNMYLNSSAPIQKLESHVILAGFHIIAYLFAVQPN